MLALVTACATTRTSSTLPAHDGPKAWRELSSEHFIVWTNTSQARAQTLVTTMETLRQVVLGVSFFKQDLRGKSFVIAFDDLDEVHQYVPPQFIAHAWSGRNVLLQPVIVLAASSLEKDRRIVTHELTHVVAFNAIQHQPPQWFAEGIAGYFETVHLDEKTASLDVGRPIENRLYGLQHAGLMRAADMFACTRAECMDERFYGTAWALVTYLLNEHRDELMQYMGKLNETPEEQQAQLWQALFPGLPPATIDVELAKWVRKGRIKILQYNIKLRAWPLTERPITDADVLAAKGLLRYLIKPASGASAEIASALGLDPTHVVANMIDAVARKSITPELAHRVTDAHPDDWRAWWLAWRAATSSAERMEARTRTCELLERTPASVPIEQCGRDASGGFAEDPRSLVLKAAQPQIARCFQKSKPAELATTFTLDIDIADSGAVTTVRAAIGSPETNACAEAIVKALTFPPLRGGTFHLQSAGLRR